jgi:hypothetical protein
VSISERFLFSFCENLNLDASLSRGDAGSIYLVFDRDYIDFELLWFGDGGRFLCAVCNKD